MRQLGIIFSPMAKNPTAGQVLPDDLEAYLALLSGLPCVDNATLLAEVEAFTHAHFSTGAHMLSGLHQGRLLSMFSHLLRPEQVLEIGTFTGYSALCMAEGLAPQGVLHTLDKDARLQSAVQDFFARSAWAGRLHLHIGPAHATLAGLPGPFNLVFIDADKRAYGHYLEAVVPKCKPGAVILLDNVLWKGSVYGIADQADDIRDYLSTLNLSIAADPRWQAVMLPVRDGLWMLRVV